MLCGIKHVSRDSKRHSKRLLCLSDSMCCVLAFSKGRCVSQALLRSCQRVASEVLAADLVVSWRWIPSEVNVADAGSRIWEHLRHGSERGLQPCQLDSAASVRSALQARRLRRRQRLVEPPAGDEASPGTPVAFWQFAQAHAVGLDPAAGCGQSGLPFPGDGPGTGPGANREQEVASAETASCPSRVGVAVAGASTPESLGGQSSSDAAGSCTWPSQGVFQLDEASEGEARSCSSASVDFRRAPPFINR